MTQNSNNKFVGKKYYINPAILMAGIILGFIFMILPIPLMDDLDVDTFSGMSTLGMSCLGAIVFVCGIILAVVNIKFANSPLVRKSGRILEKTNQRTITVEFDDGTRQNLLSGSGMLLSVGDYGIFGYKGRLIVEFEKMKG